MISKYIPNYFSKFYKKKSNYSRLPSNYSSPLSVEKKNLTTKYYYILGIGCKNDKNSMNNYINYFFGNYYYIHSSPKRRYKYYL